jgi:hypothetical protein
MNTDTRFWSISSICSYNEKKKSYRLWDNVVEQVSPQIGIWCMRIACWITKATNTHSQCVILLCNNGCTNAPHCYVIRTLPVLFFSMAWPCSSSHCKHANCVVYIVFLVTLITMARMFPRTSDLNSCYLSLWGHVKGQSVYCISTTHTCSKRSSCSAFSFTGRTSTCGEQCSM